MMIYILILSLIMVAVILLIMKKLDKVAYLSAILSVILIIISPLIEEALFIGEHYVECYIEQNGVCIATDLLRVPIYLF